MKFKYFYVIIILLLTFSMAKAQDFNIDFNCNNRINLSDIIIALKMTTGINSEPVCYSDINLNSHLDISEILYAFQKQANLNEKSTTIVINEIMITSDVEEDWVELYNAGDLIQNIGNWILKDDNDDHSYIFPESTQLAPGEYLMITKNENNETGFSFGLGKNDAVRLFDSNNSLIDSVDWSEDDYMENYSYARIPNGYGEFIVANLPSPGQKNLQNDTNGWSEQSHGENAEPDYDIAFPQDKVNRIDMTISPENWKAMLDDMTELYGEFGSGGNNNEPGDMEQVLIDACKEKQAGDSCEVVMTGRPPEIGECAMGNNILSCSINMIPPAEDQMAIDACQEKQSGDTCQIGGMGMMMEGSCVNIENVLVCEISGDPGTGGPPGGDPGTGRPGGIPGTGEPEVGEPGAGNPGDNMEFSSQNPIYVPCTFVFNDKTWNNVGVRFKGNSSLQSSWSSGNMKLPLRFDFDQFEEDYPEIKNQKFYGFKELALSSNYSDKSFIREKVTADIFREAGIPAPQTAFCRIYIDYGEGSKYFGLYTLVEIPDDPMIVSQFKETGGNLYKPESTFVSFNEEDFDKESNKSENDYSDVIAVIDALNSSRDDITTWKSKLENVFDVNGFIHWLAVNTTVQNWDTYGSMAHNYYLYTDPGDQLVHWIPWDNNEAMTQKNIIQNNVNNRNGVKADRPDNKPDRTTVSISLSEVTADWPLIRYLMDDPSYYAIYKNYLNDTIQGAFEVQKTCDRFQSLHDMVKPYVIGDDGEQPGSTFLTQAEDFENELISLKNHVSDRKDVVLEFLSNQ